MYRTWWLQALCLVAFARRPTPLPLRITIRVCAFTRHFRRYFGWRGRAMRGVGCGPDSRRHARLRQLAPSTGVMGMHHTRKGGRVHTGARRGQQTSPEWSNMPAKRTHGPNHHRPGTREISTVHPKKENKALKLGVARGQFGVQELSADHNIR